MIDWVHIAGYKCLRDVQTTTGAFNVLVGRNDSGKSSFLQALYLASNGGEASQPLWNATAKSSGFEIKWAGNEFAVRSAGPRLEVSLNGSRPSWIPGQSIPGLPRTTRPLSIDPPAIASRSTKGSGTLAALIESRGQGTAAHLARLALSDRERHDLIQNVLRETTRGRITEFKVIEDGPDYGLTYRLHDGTVIPASEASQGILILTCFLAIVHREDAPSVLLIEEPENGIHPLRLKEIVDLLRTLTKRGVQIFLTTHSPDLLSWCEPEEVLVFWRPNAESGTEIHRLPKVTVHGGG